MLLLSTSLFLCSLAETSMPYNARQVEDLYWVGGQLRITNIWALRKAGITKVVSATPLDEGTRQLLAIAGISHSSLLFGKKFPTASRVEQAVGNTPPSELYLHCKHGADRTGVLLAYVLVTQQGWAVADALMSVVYSNPSKPHVKELKALLIEKGFDASRVPRGIVGKFSGWRNGGDGGLKLHHENYRFMVRTVLDRMD